LIAVALQERFPRDAPHPKKCSQCENEFQHSGFSDRQWSLGEDERRCRQCLPVPESQQRSCIDVFSCSRCHEEKPRRQFSESQWKRGDKSKCVKCVNEITMSQTVRLRRCCGPCGQDKCPDEFSKTQRQNKVTQWKCLQCCEAALKKTQYKVQKSPGKEKGAVQKTGSPASGREVPHWKEVTKEAALRWALEGPETALPSECPRSYQAVCGLRGDAQWWTKTGVSPKASDFPVRGKLELFKTAHEQDLSHSRGRDGIVQVLRTELGERVWRNVTRLQSGSWMIQEV
jgi:hypothetical protein